MTGAATPTERLGLATPVADVAGRRLARVRARRRTAAALARLAVFLAVAWAAFTWVFALVVVEGDGMKPSAGDGDVALVLRLGEPEADSMVAFADSEGHVTVSRVVAVPGDEVEVTDSGAFLVNGTAQPSPSGEVTMPASSGVAYPLTLGEGEWFLLGDGRTVALDSRSVGAVSAGQMVGTVVALLRLRGM